MCRSVEQGPLWGCDRIGTYRAVSTGTFLICCGVASIDEADGTCFALRSPALATIPGT